MITVMTLKDFQLLQLQQQPTLFEGCNFLPTDSGRKACVLAMALKVDGCGLPPNAKEAAFTNCIKVEGITDTCKKRDAVFGLVQDNKCLDITVEQFCTNFLNKKNSSQLQAGLPACI